MEVKVTQATEEVDEEVYFAHVLAGKKPTTCK